MNNNKSNSGGGVAVITGAGGTLCSEMARVLAGQDYRVALLGRTLEKLKIVEEQISASGGKALAIATDVTSEEAVKDAAERIEKELGSCNVLINGAGGNMPEAMPNILAFDKRELDSDEAVKGFFNLSMDTYRQVIDINTMGTVIPSFVFGRVMARQESGSIINFASMTSYRALSKVSAYAIAKGGIVNFTQWLGAYLAPANIRVNAIAPGFFLNTRSRKFMYNEDGTQTERGTSILRQTPMGRFGEANELIGCMNWLIDEEKSGFVTGITIPIDGGFLSHAGI